MAEITKEEYRASAARGSDLRDVVAAWLVCALVGSIAFAVSSDFHAPPASALVAVPIPRAAGEAPARINPSGHLHIAEPVASGPSQ
jgi:hypothetical protein